MMRVVFLVVGFDWTSFLSFSKKHQIIDFSATQRLQQLSVYAPSSSYKFTTWYDLSLYFNTLVRIIETQQQQRRLRRANHANRINSMLSPVASFAHSQLVDELTGISSVKPPSLTLLFYVFIRVHLGLFLLTRRFFLISLLSSRWRRKFATQVAKKKTENFRWHFVASSMLSLVDSRSDALFIVVFACSPRAALTLYFILLFSLRCCEVKCGSDVLWFLERRREQKRRKKVSWRESLLATKIKEDTEWRGKKSESNEN